MASGLVNAIKSGNLRKFGFSEDEIEKLSVFFDVESSDFWDYCYSLGIPSSEYGFLECLHDLCIAHPAPRHADAAKVALDAQLRDEVRGFARGVSQEGFPQSLATVAATAEAREDLAR